MNEKAKSEKPNFQPTPDMLSAAQALVMAMAFVETVKPIVVAYQTEILAKRKWFVSREWVARGLNDANDVVSNPSDSFLLDSEDSEIFFEQCRAARDAAGLKVEKDDHCPLLVAENLVRKARVVLIDTMEPITRLSYEKLASSANCVANIDQAVDLTLKLLAPFLDKRAMMHPTA